MNQEVTPAQSGTEPAPIQMNDDEILNFTRGIRVVVVKDLMTNGKAPTETGDRILLTSMLKDLDSQALTSKKISSDEKKADNTAAVVAELLRNINKNTAFTSLGNSDNNIIDVTAQVVPASILDMPALPGEMDVAPPQLDYTSFVRSQGKDIDQLGRDVVHPESDDDDIP